MSIVVIKIPERDKSIIATAKPNGLTLDKLTLDQAFAIFWKRYEESMKELSQK